MSSTIEVAARRGRRSARSACAARVRLLAAATRERAAAARDGHVERGLDLPQVRVERAAQIGERPIVERREVTSWRSRRPLMALVSGPRGAAGLKRLDAPSAPSKLPRLCSRLRRDAPAFPCRDRAAQARSAIAGEARGHFPVAAKSYVGRRGRGGAGERGHQS